MAKKPKKTFDATAAFDRAAVPTADPPWRPPGVTLCDMCDRMPYDVFEPIGNARVGRYLCRGCSDRNKRRTQAQIDLWSDQ